MMIDDNASGNQVVIQALTQQDIQLIEEMPEFRDAISERVVRAKSENLEICAVSTVSCLAGHAEDIMKMDDESVLAIFRSCRRGQ